MSKHSSERNAYLISRSFRSFLLASILTGIVSQVCSLTDAVLVSNLVDSKGLSAMNYIMPVNSLMYAIIMILTSGAGILAARELGSQNSRRALNIFYVALTSALILIVSIAVCISVFMPQVMGFICTDAAIAPLVEDYLKVYLLVYPIEAISAVLFRYVKVDGAPQMVTRVVILSSVLNIVFDLLFISVFHLGIAGSAWGTVCSYTISELCFLPYLRKNNALGNYVPRGHDYNSMLGHNVTMGTPNALTDGLLALVVFLINEAVMKAQGTDGMFIWSMILRISTLTTMLLWGFCEVNNSVGGVMMGERDYSGLRLLATKSLRFIVIGVVCLIAILCLFADYLPVMFGNDEPAVRQACVAPLRIAFSFLLPYVCLRFMCVLLAQQGRILMSIVFSSLTILAMAGGVLLVGAFSEEHIWWGFPMLTYPLLGVLLLVIYVLHKRNQQLSAFALLPLYPDEVSVQYSVEYTNESVEQALKDVTFFVELCEVPDAVSNRVRICCSELLENLLAYSKDNGEGHTFEVCVIDNEKHIEVRVKDGGHPFDPTLSAKALEESIGEEPAHLGLTLVNSLCSSLSYKYMFGLNVTIMKFDKESTL